MGEKQRTLKSPVSFSGKGLHTGAIVNMTIKPAAENTGYRFKRVDLEGQPEVRAIVENVIDTSRSTIIEENGARVGTIEHTLSALYGLGYDNALIEIDAAETPIMDGSAREYTEALLKNGYIEQNADKDFYVIKKTITYADEENGISLMTFPDNSLTFNVMIDYNSEVLGNQYAALNNLKDFPTEIAPCRTFVFFRDLEILHKNNLIKGGDLDNAIVIVERPVAQSEIDRICSLFNKPTIKADKEQGILNNVSLKFHNEPARHKLLDLMGDLALVGQPIKGRILATRPGHYSNVEFAKRIRQEIKKGKSKSLAPEIDLNAVPKYNINQIKGLLPHRSPFLLIDKIMSVTENEVIGVKNVTMNEPFFVGHFPDEPIMPGVLQIEAMAQTGGILVLSQVEDPENYLTFFMKIDNVKFRRQVVPGDTLVFRLELTAPIKRGIVNMHAQAFVGENLVTEGDLMAQIVKVK
ncbi:MAG TPA: UDP-3-O-[3-hydroxymyristoyl] N-acetylglucosamine deacetylase [Bacteroidales bacterium]|nr:UDP-3-O-[3-hydroxymyristoyl] N-acetylglucosamine deacetylase [Bacteroidales bacterium]